ncbi:hypothetical protein [Microbaculum marinum]|uniref:Lipoprotein n=1 Tax=Microbaculum marinum TaxID=1764581 RepID=A0AAW9RQ28_9HYPH
MTKMRTTVLAAAAAAVAGLAACGPAQAVWRVVGPGIAVGEARAGNATIAAECLHDGLVLGIYNIHWEFEHGEELDLVVDGRSFTLHQYPHADKIVFSDVQTAGGHLDISADLIAALKSGSQARLAGAAVEHLDPKAITFGLVRSEAALTTVERYCD